MKKTREQNDEALRDTMRPEVMAALPLASLDPVVVQGSTVSPSVQKTVLIILAASEGNRISIRAIAAYAQVDASTAQRAILAMQMQGVVRQQLTEPGQANVYEIDAEALAANQVREEAVKDNAIRSAASRAEDAACGLGMRRTG